MKYERGEQCYQRGWSGPRRRVVASSYDIYSELYNSGERVLSPIREQLLECGHSHASFGGLVVSDIVRAAKRKLNQRLRCCVCGDPEKESAFAELVQQPYYKSRFAPAAIDAMYRRVESDCRTWKSPSDILVEACTALLDKDGGITILYTERLESLTS
jgi:hypothetical protein